MVLIRFLDSDRSNATSVSVFPSLRKQNIGGKDNVFQKNNTLMGMSQAVIRELDDSKRSRCAIMFADILGFTSLMKQDEHRTILKLESHRTNLEILHQQFGGRIVQYYGDGSLSVFATAEQAVRCAIAIQENVARLKLPLKIGIHHGEVVEKGSAVYGDGINVASRIESVGIARSILVSEDLWVEIKNKGFEAQSLGALQFKNIPRPIKVFGLVHAGLVVPDRKTLEGKLENRVGYRYKSILLATILFFLITITGLWRYNVYLNSLLNDNITTVGVIPFRFKEVKGLDASFQSGLLENLVTHLSSFYGLQVLSSRSTEPYANSTQKPTEIGSELGVSHLLYGTLRQGQNDSIRINMELVDARNGRNIWAKSVSKLPEDFFADPDDLSADLMAFLEARDNPYIDEEVQTSSKLSLTTYRLLTEAREEMSKRTGEGFMLANDLLQIAVAKDSSFALGHALLSQNYSLMHAYDFMDAEQALDQAEQYGGKALFLNRNLAEGYVSNALMQYSFFQENPQEILDLLQEAVLLRPSYDYAYYLIGKIYFDLQDYEMAANYLSLAAKLNPDESLYLRLLARTALAAGDRKEARSLYGLLQRKFSENQEVIIDLIHYYSTINVRSKIEPLLEKIPDRLIVLKARLSIAIDENDWEEADELMAEIAVAFPKLNLDPLLVLYYDRKGEQDRLWELLQKAVKEKEVWLKDIGSMKMQLEKNNPEKYQELLIQLKLVSFHP